MREMRGLISVAPYFAGKSLKKRALLFDTFEVMRLSACLKWLATCEKPFSSELMAEAEFLQLNEFLKEAPFPREMQEEIAKLVTPSSSENQITFTLSDVDFLTRLLIGAESNVEFGGNNLSVADAVMRELFARSDIAHDEYTLMYQNSLTETFSRKIHGPEEFSSSMQAVLSVATAMLPVPGEEASWIDILDFKSESQEKLWGFRRFLRTLATKKQSEAEIRDDLEWCPKRISERNETT
jgi:hypothetical protein